MTRDELIEDITTEVKKVIPENIELDGDDLQSVQDCVESTINTANEAIDESEDEDTDAEEEKE